MLRSDRRKRQRELKSIISAGRLFHTFTTRQAKNIWYLHGYDLHRPTIYKGDQGRRSRGTGGRVPQNFGWRDRNVVCPPPPLLAKLGGDTKCLLPSKRIYFTIFWLHLRLIYPQNVTSGGRDRKNSARSARSIEFYTILKTVARLLLRWLAEYCGVRSTGRQTNWATKAGRLGDTFRSTGRQSNNQPITYNC